jgi:hypothetical protein
LEDPGKCSFYEWQCGEVKIGVLWVKQEEGLSVWVGSSSFYYCVTCEISLGLPPSCWALLALRPLWGPLLYDKNYLISPSQERPSLCTEGAALWLRPPAGCLLGFLSHSHL